VTEKNTPPLMDVAEDDPLYDELSHKSLRRRNLILTWIIIILLVLWLLGYFGPNVYAGIPRSGNVVHTLLVIAVILIVLNVLGVI